jgi:7-cyano-7-deazaguanine synthase
MDSAAALCAACREGYLPLALTMDYGQLHRRELQSAVRIAKHLNVEHQILKVPLPWRGSALLDSGIPIPIHRNPQQISKEIPVTYVPARNTIFLSLAASFAEARGAAAIFIGANALDYSGYPDCRPEYFEQFESLLRFGTKCGVEGKRIEIKAPLISMTKSEIIKLAIDVGVPLELTWSCYAGGRAPCGGCDACILRAKGFEEAGMEDPALLPSSRGARRATKQSLQPEIASASFETLPRNDAHRT